MRKTLLIVAYLAFAAVNFGGLNANDRARHSMGDLRAREQCGFSLLWALLPPGAVVTPFVTGFYAAGLDFSCGSISRPL